MDRRLESQGLENRDRSPVKNVDLWQRLDTARQRHEVSWHWVKGHAGDPGNERADKLTQRAIKEQEGTAKGVPPAPQEEGL